MEISPNPLEADQYPGFPLDTAAMLLLSILQVKVFFVWLSVYLFSQFFESGGGEK